MRELGCPKISAINTATRRDQTNKYRSAINNTHLPFLKKTNKERSEPGRYRTIRAMIKTGRMRFTENLINSCYMFHRDDKSFKILVLGINTSFIPDLVVGVGDEYRF